MLRRTVIAGLVGSGSGHPTTRTSPRGGLYRSDAAVVGYDAVVPAATIALGVALIVLGLGGYVLTGAVSLTALIPAAFGLLLALAGLIGRDDRRRMHAMHAAVVLALLGFLGSVRGLLRIGDVFHATSARPAAIVSQTIMALLTLGYIVVAVRSFVQARKARRAA